MGALRSLFKVIKLFVLENAYARKINIHNDKAIFSFTFDDAPLSAATNGAKILESHNATGTYYLALGIDSSHNSQEVAIEPYLSTDVIRSLHNKGHEIGSCSV